MVKNIRMLIVDELCSCGHRRSQHKDTLAKGHGACDVRLVAKCMCPKFTWVAFLDKNGKQL